MFASDAHEALDQDVAHEILRCDRRRLTLECLRQRLNPISLRTLSERVAELETGESPPPRDLRKSVYVSLHQTHLPKLEDVGVVEYDKQSKEVVLAKHARAFDPYIDVTNPFGITWGIYYRTLGIAGLGTTILAEIGLPVIGSLDPLPIATVFMFVFAFSTAYQVWKGRWYYLRALFAGS